MEIKYLGHSSFRIKAEGQTVIIDPFEPQSTGLKWEKQAADLVLVTHAHFDHNFIAGVAASENYQGQFKRPFIVSAPGEYEIGGVRVTGIASFHDGKSGSVRGENTIYLVEVENFKIVHLGDLGHKVSSEQESLLSDTDVLIVPVGDKVTIGPEIASELIAELAPHFAIPCHFSTPELKVFGLRPLEDFLKVMGGEARTEEKLVLKEGCEMPEETQVIVLKYA